VQKFQWNPKTRSFEKEWINRDTNHRDYLSLANVACVGGSWIVPDEAVEREDWDRITALAREALQFSR
jgi:2-keto-3-deoxy-6-phosphogluconate aldolase